MKDLHWLLTSLINAGEIIPPNKISLEEIQRLLHIIYFSEAPTAIKIRQKLIDD